MRKKSNTITIICSIFACIGLGYICYWQYSLGETLYAILFAALSIAQAVLAVINYKKDHPKNKDESE